MVDRSEHRYSWTMIMPLMTEEDGVMEADGFRQAIGTWARGYSLRYRRLPGAKPTLAQAQEDLRRWSAGYWSRCRRIVKALASVR